MTKPALGFSRLSFHLRPAHNGGVLLAGICGQYTNHPDLLFLPKTESAPELPTAEVNAFPENIWERMTNLSAIAACTYLLLQRTQVWSELDRSLQYLQRECSLPAICSGPNLGKGFTSLFRSGLDGYRLFPFQQRRLQGKYVTCVYDDALKLGLTAEHFSFLLHDSSTPVEGWLGNPNPTVASPSALEAYLQAGHETGISSFRANWDRFSGWEDCPKPVQHQVPLKELGPILGQYRKLIGLTDRTIVDRFESFRPNDRQWPKRALGTSEDIRAFFENKVFLGDIDDVVPFPELKRLLFAFDDPDDVKDVPDLMAEWLTAESQTSRSVVLPLSEFSSPTGVKHGTKTTYTNAPFRLQGMECALVRLELDGNRHPPTSKHGKAGVVDRLSELLRNIDDEAAQSIPHSNLHVHPGDELIYVIEGTVFVELENTGIWTPLLEGDYIHFNAEIPHSVWNTSADKAVAIIVRFFQLERHGTRRRQNDILSQIESLMERFGKDYSAARDARIALLDRLAKDFPKWVGDTRQSYRLWTQIAPWVHDRTRAPQDRLRVISDESRVEDLVGLSKFLQTHVAHDFPDQRNDPESLKQLKVAIQNVAKCDTDEATGGADGDFARYVEYQNALTRFCRDQFDEGDIPEVRSCFEGVPADGNRAPGNHVLTKVAQLLGIPRVLLDGYLATTALRVVVVRGAKTARKNELKDWVEPLQGARGSGAARVEYLLPARSLANSDMSMTLLNLEASGHSDWNHHPGFELVLPIRGRVHVEFRDDQQQPTESVGEEALLVYRSAYSHRVCNSHSGESRLLVMRFNIPEQALRSN